MKIFLSALILAGMAMTSVAQAASPFRTIAFPLGGLVVQEIPARNVHNFNPSDVVTIDDNGRSRSYAIRPGAREVLSRLSSDYKLVIMTTERPEVAKALAEGIQLPNGQTLSRAVSSMKSGIKELDLTLIQKKYGDILYLRPSSFTFKDQQAGNTFDMGPAYYAFPSYESYQALGGGQGKYFPKDAADWATENYKWFRFITIFELADGGENSADFKLRVQKVMKDNSVDDLIRYGKSTVRFVEQPAPGVPAVEENWVKAWKAGYDDNGRWAASCIYRNQQGAYVKLAPLEECLKTLTTTTKLVKDQGGNWACQRVNESGYFVRAEPSLDSCIAGGNFNGKYMWTISGDKGCDLYSEKNELIQHADPGKCQGKNDAIVADYDGGLGTFVFTLTPEMTGMSATEIIKSLSKGGPTLLQPYRLWDQTPQPEIAGLDLKECDTGTQSMRKDQDGNLLSQCQPDTLYTWSPQIKLDWFKKLMPNDGTPWPQNLPRAIFSARAPVATFGYGEIAIRIKLNKGTHFVDSHYYHTCSADDDPNTVYYRADSSYSDWVICSANVIASWSYDTKEQYDEMIRDRQRVLKVKAKQMAVVNYDFYQGRNSESVDTMFGSLDGHSFSEEVFAKRFTDALTDINNGGGGIYFNPSLPDSEKTREKHFATDHPIYFNQQ